MIGWLLLVHVAATLFMVGLIWFVQIVHYPLFGSVGQAEFPGYEQAHVQRTSWVVIPAMLIELITAMILVVVPPPGVADWLPIVGLVLLGVIGASTQFLQVPCHARLTIQFDTATHRWLVRSNWVRTVAWTLRGGVVLAMLSPPAP